MKLRDENGVALLPGDRVKITEPGMVTYGQIMFNPDWACYMVRVTHRQYPGRFERWEDLRSKTACWRVLHGMKRRMLTRRLKGVEMIGRAPEVIRVAPTRPAYQ